MSPFVTIQYGPDSKSSLEELAEKYFLSFDHMVLISNQYLHDIIRESNPLDFTYKANEEDIVSAATVYSCTKQTLEEYRESLFEEGDIPFSKDQKPLSRGDLKEIELVKHINDSDKIGFIDSIECPKVGQGDGREMLEHLQEQYSCLFVISYGLNEFYEKCGFVSTGYANEEKDCSLMVWVKS